MRRNRSACRPDAYISPVNDAKSCEQSLLEHLAKARSTRLRHVECVPLAQLSALHWTLFLGGYRHHSPGGGEPRSRRDLLSSPQGHLAKV